ncbi:hypothetical protein [Nocardioides sp. J54]|uniref:hypothetical protein n=1 Tax=Nocardioides sp. J54 TaxID=935866 RepID=UPI0012FB967D|nr:hypothetical protein [Nocardioides sp. J54]
MRPDNERGRPTANRAASNASLNDTADSTLRSRGRAPHRLQAAFVTPACAYLRGWGSRELLTEITGRAPVFGARVRAWHAQPPTARDAIAEAEERGWVVEIVTEEHLLRLAGADLEEIQAAAAERRGELW